MGILRVTAVAVAVVVVVVDNWEGCIDANASG